ncbi:uncharacterized protein O3Q21_013522 [Podargus strigoides]
MSPEPGGLQPQHSDLQLDQVHLQQRQEVHRRRLRDLALSLGGRGRLQPRSATGAPQEEGRTEGERSVLPGKRSEQRHERELRKGRLCEGQSCDSFLSRNRYKVLFLCCSNSRTSGTSWMLSMWGKQ